MQAKGTTLLSLNKDNLIADKELFTLAKNSSLSRKWDQKEPVASKPFKTSTFTSANSKLTPKYIKTSSIIKLYIKYYDRLEKERIAKEKKLAELEKWRKELVQKEIQEKMKKRKERKRLKEEGAAKSAAKGTVKAAPKPSPKK